MISKQCEGQPQQKTVHLAAWRCGTYSLGEDSTYRRQRGAVLIALVGPMLLLKSCMLILLQRTDTKDGDDHITLSNEEEGWRRRLLY